MFTGIVEEAGVVRRVTDEEGGRRVRIGTDELSGFAHGQSISVSGVCLTVEQFGDDWFEVFTARETLDRTYLDSVEEGDLVNLERAMPADGRFDGHVVQGHVDTTAEVVAVEPVGEDWTFTFELPESVARYVVEKGSVTLDGISLTVAALDDEAGTFSVAIIPTTYELTNFHDKAPGDQVHVEVDVLAKYVERMLNRD
ncbi:riboflavin synthase [Halobacteriaceae archaeon GCM10025711]